MPLIPKKNYGNCWKIALLSLSLLLGLRVAGQGQLLDDFSLRSSEAGVQVNWVISGNQQCNGVKVFRGSASGDYQIIGGIDGVCGGSDFPSPYSILDSMPLPNQEAFYFLKLGNQGYSDTLSLTWFKFDAKPLLLYPNPGNAQSIVVVPDERHVLWIEVFNSEGTKMLRHPFEHFYTFDSFQAAPGVYWVVIYQDEILTAQGSFIWNP